MSNRHLLLKAFSIISLILTLGVSMSAGAGLFGFGGTSWKEEALLHDGSKLIVERSVERGGRHEIGQKPPIKEQSLTFTMPGTNQNVIWEDKYSEDVGGANFLPMLVDVLNNTVYLVVTPMGSLSYNKWGRPNPPYVLFKYQGKEWKRIPLQELPDEIKTPNLVISSPDDAAEKVNHGIVFAGMIKELNDGARQPEYKTIYRTPLDHWKLRPGTNNGELIRTEDGWASPDMVELRKKVEDQLKAQREAGSSKK